MHYLNLHVHMVRAFSRKRAQINRLFGEPLVWLEQEVRPHGHDNNENKFTIWQGRDRTLLASFRIGTLPGCCGTAVLTYRSVACQKTRQKALAKIILKIQEEACNNARFTQLLATALLNSEDAALYEQNAWNEIAQYVNEKTGNTVRMFTKILVPLPKGATKFGAET